MSRHSTEGGSIALSEEGATMSMKEYIFWRDGMTPEEFEKELDYYYTHIEDLKNGRYLPLWKQEL